MVVTRTSPRSPIRLPVLGIARRRALTVGAASFLLLVSACGTTGDLSLGTLTTRASTNVGRDASPTTTVVGSSGQLDGGAGVTDAAVPTVPAVVPTVPMNGEAGTGPSPSNDPSMTADCSEPLPEPTERFDMSGTGVELVDVQGGPSGQLFGGARLTGTGDIELDGDDDYIDLPNGLLSRKTSATIALWVSLVDGPAYWRVFDFGRGSEGEDPTEFAVGTYYVALTTETGLDPSGLALLVGYGGASSEDRALTERRVDGEMAAVFAVLDGDAMRVSLYLDGRRVADTPMSSPLSQIGDVNNWLGRSQYSADPNYPGTYDELRFYSRALSACDVERLVELGPDVLR